MEWDASARIAYDSKNDTQITQVPISKLYSFEGHPYKVLDDAEMDELTESIREHGIMSPLLLRPLEGSPGEYEVISGHRRIHAAQRAGLDTVPAFVHAIDRDAASILLVDSNLHREHILPSEKAFAYKLKFEAMKHQGRTSGQVGPKLTVDTISEDDSGRRSKSPPNGCGRCCPPAWKESRRRSSSSRPATITGSIFSASVTPDEGRDRDGKAAANGFSDRGRPCGDGFVFSGAESRRGGPSETDAACVLCRSSQICKSRWG